MHFFIFCIGPKPKSVVIYPSFQNPFTDFDFIFGFGQIQNMKKNAKDRVFCFGNTSIQPPRKKSNDKTIQQMLNAFFVLRNLYAITFI